MKAPIPSAHPLDSLYAACQWSPHGADDTKVFLSTLQPELMESLVVRQDTFALASEQHINIAKSCVVPLGTLPPPSPSYLSGSSGPSHGRGIQEVLGRHLRPQLVGGAVAS
jgi:hypothetical protein